MSKKFTELNAGTIGAGSIFAQAQEPALSGDPYTSTKVSATQIANYVAKGQAFTELNNQTIIQAITGGSGAGTVILTMAQYIALTPAQQTDGHIYVISDFACIFCYGRQYRALQELERAQYDQLSPAEQNNGTLYIITDEETTADDIPYSAGVSVADKLDNVPTFDTLTTSDNNKLLGVSVSGDDISVEAVGIETITLTPQTGITVGGSLKCKKFGNIAVVSIQNVTFANTGVNQLLIKGAPNALETVYSSKPAGSNLTNTNNIAPNVAYVDNNGYIYFNIHTSNTTPHWISLVYPCE